MAAVGALSDMASQRGGAASRDRDRDEHFDVQPGNNTGTSPRRKELKSSQQVLNPLSRSSFLQPPLR